MIEFFYLTTITNIHVNGRGRGRLHNTTVVAVSTSFPSVRDQALGGLSFDQGEVENILKWGQ